MSPLGRFEGKTRKDGRFWLVEIPSLDVMTQGRTRSEALVMIADAIEGHVDKPGFKITVRSRPDDTFDVGSPDIAALTALLLRRRRQASGLTLAEVAKRLGAQSHNAYARYEQGRSFPTIDKLVKLLAIVDKGHDVVIGRSEA
ncbi:MAG: type II toxin-antitoxin system HicB family antitoxin [Vicinamibacteria bacterium]|nr:type II toxin-antitoxin system HicB family antitoxin [Vicinamibacteria bacterium]